jgi:hypothetical protein
MGKQSRAKAERRRNKHVPDAVERVTRDRSLPAQGWPDNLPPSRPAIVAVNSVGRISGSNAGAMQLLEVIGDQSSVVVEDCVDRGEHIRHRTFETRGDEHAASTIVTDRGGTPVVTARERRRPTKDEDEMRALRWLALSWNAHHGTHYEAHHQPDTSQYEDGYLRSSNPAEDGEIPVQVTHLDAALKETLSRDGYVLNYDLGQLTAAVEAALEKKKNVDAATKGKTVLALTCPVGIGTSAIDVLRTTPFELHGFRDVWVCATQEVGFRLVRR